MRHDGSDEDTLVPQQQRRNGRVQYDHPEHRDELAALLAKGPETYYVNRNDQSKEVESTHAEALAQERNGGKHQRLELEAEPGTITC